MNDINLNPKEEKQLLAVMQIAEDNVKLALERAIKRVDDFLVNEDEDLKKYRDSECVRATGAAIWAYTNVRNYLRQEIYFLMGNTQ